MLRDAAEPDANATDPPGVVQPKPPSCGLDALLACDDGEPCTVDRVDEASCECVHESHSAGAVCNDGNVCTAGDACQQGQCRGQVVTSQPEVLGTLNSFGAAPALGTLTAIPYPGRALFASGSTLSWVRVEEGQAQLLDQQDLGTFVRVDAVGPMTRLNRPRTFMLPVLEQLVAVVSQNWGIDLFDVSADTLERSERYGFDGFQGDVRGVAAWGSRLWVCSIGAVHTFVVDPTARQLSLGPELSLPVGHSCQDLAIGPEGERLFAATRAGLDVIDVSSETGALSVVEQALPGADLIQVEVGQDYLAVFALEDIFAAIGRVDVLRLDDFSGVARVVPDSARGGLRPMGFAWVQGNTLLLQEFRFDGCAEHVARLVEVSTEGFLERQRWTSLQACETPLRAPSHNTVGGHGVAVLEPMHRLLALSPERDRLVAVASPQQGSFESLVPGAEGHLLAHSAGSFHRVDLQDPSTLSIIEGGLVEGGLPEEGRLRPLSLEGLRWDISPGQPLRLLSVLTHERTLGPFMSRLRSWPSGEPELAPSLVAPDLEGAPKASARWLLAGSYAYELREPSTSELLLVRYPSERLSNPETTQLVPDWAQGLSFDVGPLDLRAALTFDVDPKTGDVAIAEQRSQLGVSGSSLTRVRVHRFGAQGYEAGEVLAESLFAPVGVLQRAGVTYAISQTRVEAYRVGEAPLVLDTLEVGFTVNEVLGTQGGRLYLSVGLGGALRGVAVLQLADLSEVSRYETPQAVLSFTEVGGRLAFGMGSSLAVAAPACPAVEP